LGQVPTLTPQWGPNDQYRAAAVLVPKFVDPLVQQWNLTIQHQFGSNLSFDIAYVGHRLDRGVSMRRTFNQSEPPGYTFYYADGASFTTTASTPTAQLAKYPQLGRASTYFNETWALYNALQVNVVKNYSHGLQFRAGYTFSKNLGFSADFADRQDEWGEGRPKNRLDYDHPQEFFATYIWQIPFGSTLKGVPRHVLQGWSLAGSTVFRTGKVFSVLNQRSPFVGNNTATHPDRLCNGNLPESQQTPRHWFQTTCFVTPATPRYGNAAANYMEEDGQANFDLMMAKSFRIREGHSLQFRFEAFNAFNHPTFGLPQNRVGNAAYGVVSYTENSARDLQLGLKYQF
jgi:hypothetical protein